MKKHTYCCLLLIGLVACNSNDANVPTDLKLTKDGFVPVPVKTTATAADTNSTSNEVAQVGQTEANKKYRFPWLAQYDDEDMLLNRILPPPGYERLPTGGGSFADWLRNLPLKKGKPPVLRYDGSPKANQSVHVAVVDIDVGETDLQQCADAVMRLRAEYLYQANSFSAIHFNYTNSTAASYSKWREGYRPVFKGNKTTWVKKAKADGSYKVFKQYMNSVFNYCGTFSLNKELKSIAVEDIKSGDVFIQGGFPGHAILVMDVAQNPKTKEKVFLLAQSYMPAQNIHILVNPNNSALSPWYSINFGNNLQTPEWTFANRDLKRF